MICHHATRVEQLFAREDIEQCLAKVPQYRDWELGSFFLEHPSGGCCLYEIYDREFAPYWLIVGSWSNWDRAQCLWEHLSWINDTLLQASTYMSLLGSMLPDVRWHPFEPFFMGLGKRRSSTPYLDTITKDNPPRFENLVQLTGFLRLLQHHASLPPSMNRKQTFTHLEKKARALILAARKYIPSKAVFREWENFYVRNARSIASSNSYKLTLSLGPYATSCFAYSNRGSLLIDFPFFLNVDVQDIDLCEILYAFLDLCIQDRQYLINLYYDMCAPSHFFTLLAHHHMTKMLESLNEKGDNDSERKALIDRFAELGRSYSLFSSPVPTWYK